MQTMQKHVIQNTCFYLKIYLAILMLINILFIASYHTMFDIAMSILIILHIYACIVCLALKVFSRKLLRVLCFIFWQPIDKNTAFILTH